MLRKYSEDDLTRTEHVDEWFHRCCDFTASEREQSDMVIRLLNTYFDVIVGKIRPSR